MLGIEMMTENSPEFYVDLYKKQGWVVADAEKLENIISESVL